MSNMLASLGNMMDGYCQPGMMHGACLKLCHEAASSSSLQGGCSSATSLTNVELKMTGATLKPSRLSMLNNGCRNTNNQCFTSGFDMSILVLMCGLGQSIYSQGAVPVQFASRKRARYRCRKEWWRRQLNMSAESFRVLPKVFYIKVWGFLFVW